MNVEEYVRRRIKPIFDQALKETPKNRISVGEGGFKKAYAFYQPHNCRVYFDFKRPSKPYPGSTVVVHNSSESMFRDLVLGCRVTVKKTQVEVINLVDSDKRYVVNMFNSYEETLAIIVKKVLQARKAVEKIVKLYGGSSQFQVLRISLRENKVEHEAFIDSIPARSKFRNEVVKKVYNAHNVEFGDPVFEINYLTNQAALMDSFDIFKWCESNIQSLSDVFKLGKVISTLSQDHRLILSNYLFQRFGGGVLNG